MMRLPGFPRFLLILGLAGFLAGPRYLLAEEWLIRAGKVYTLTGAPLAPGMVHVKNGKIVEVAEEIAAPEGVKVIDLSQGVLIPGLVDARSQVGIESSVNEITQELTPNYKVHTAINWQSRSFREALAEGVTTLGLMPGTENVISGQLAVVKTAGPLAQRTLVEAGGLVITVASDPANRNSSRQRPDSIYVRQPTNRMGVVWMLRQTFASAQAPTNGTPSVIHEALTGKRTIYGVSRIDSDILSLLRLGKDYQFTPVLVEGNEAYKVKETLASAKVPVLLTKVTTQAGTAAEGSEVFWNQGGELHDAGVTFAFTGGHLLDQARFAIRFGCPKGVALEAITKTPARLLGVESRVGTIAVGQDADLLALTGDPFELTTGVAWVMTQGQWHGKK